MHEAIGTTVPLLPSGAMDETLAFWEALGC